MHHGPKLNIISLVTNSLVPVGDVTIITKNLDNSEISIYFDRDNGIISDKDIFIPTIKDKNKIILSAEFVTNQT